ncbi:hypothetical protein HZB60_10660 [candidate division KSB1 bacterium]|nr:hypothetical protein [candidate division KSB1 bacterium]
MKPAEFLHSMLAMSCGLTRGIARFGSFLAAGLMLLSRPTGAAAAELPSVLVETQSRCEQFLASARDMTVVQEMTMAEAGDTIVSVQTIYRRGADNRTDVRLQGPDGLPAGMPTTVITRGGKTTLLTPMGAEELGPEAAAEYEPERICWDFTNHEATIIGEATVDGHECDVVEMVEDDQRFRLNVDRARFLVLGGELVSADGEQLHWRFSEFAPASYDFELPRLIEMYAGDVRVSLLRVTAVAVNSGLSDAIFDPAQVEMPTADELLQQMMGGQEQK